MKTQITSLCAIIVLTSSVFAQEQKPIFIGAVEQQEELLIFKPSLKDSEGDAIQINCKGYSVPQPDGVHPTDPKTIVYAKWTDAILTETGLMADGDIDNEIFSLTVSFNRGTANASIQEFSTQPGFKSSYAVSSSGGFSADNGRIDATITIKGRTKTVGCGVYKQKTQTRR